MANDTAEAKALFEAIVRDDQEPPGIVRHSAAIHYGQLTGAFKARQSAWLGRQVVETVVLVPDEASFIEAVQVWPADRFWPVLIEDGWFAPMFIEAFAPRHVVRWSSGGKPADEGALAESLGAVLSRWNQSLGDGAAAGAPAPPGMVVIDPTGPQRCAGLALAIGHGQPGVALTYAEQGPRRDMPLEEQALKLNAGIMTAMLHWKLLNDSQWCGLTLAGPYPYRYRLAQGKQPQLPGGIAWLAGPMAVDDRLGRDGRGLRLAVTGRLTGSATQSVYQAMCSLFLQPKRLLMLDDYPNRGRAGSWSAFYLSNPAELFRSRYEVEALSGPDAAITMFRARTRPLNRFDMVWINSSGGESHWNVRGQGTQDDIPVGRPTIVHMIHSFSAADPHDADTIAGKAIAGGAYWYYGAVHEPYLPAFEMPTVIAHKAMSGTPLAFAARHAPTSPFYVPWRVMLVGDPLYALRHEPARRIDGRPFEDGVAIDAALKQALAAEPRNWAAVLRCAVLAEAMNHAGAGDAAAAAPAPLVEAATHCLANPAALDPSDLGRAVLIARVADRRDLIARLPLDVAVRHPIAAAELRQLIYDRYEQQLRLADLDAAKANLAQLIVLRDSRQRLTERAKMWVDKMIAASRQTEAVDFVYGYFDDRKQPTDVRFPLRSALPAELHRPAER